MTITRQTILLILMLCFLASGGFYYMYILPLAREQEKLQADLERERQFVAALQKASHEKETNGVIRFPPDFQYQIPEAPYLEQLMLDMTRAETISGVDMDGIGLSDGSARQEEAGSAQQKQEQEIRFTPIGGTPQGQNGAIPGLKRVSITTKIKGNYEQIHRFFAEVLSLPRLIRVEQVKVSAGGKDNFIILNPQDDQRKEMSVEVSLSAYYAPKLKQYFPQPLPIIAPQPAHRSNPFY
jgi:Tfp pilus assembly protein PilO